MKALVEVEISPGKKVCTGSVDNDCRFYNIGAGWCELFGTPLSTEPYKENKEYGGRPLRCKKCKEVFKEGK